MVYILLFGGVRSSLTLLEINFIHVGTLTVSFLIWIYNQFRLTLSSFSSLAAFGAKY